MSDTLTDQFNRIPETPIAHCEECGCEIPVELVVCGNCDQLDIDDGFYPSEEDL